MADEPDAVEDWLRSEDAATRRATHPQLVPLMVRRWHVIQTRHKHDVEKRFLCVHSLRYEEPFKPRLRRFLLRMVTRHVVRLPILIRAMAGFYIQGYTADDIVHFYAEENTAIGDPAGTVLETLADVRTYAEDFPSHQFIVEDFGEQHETIKRIYGVSNILFWTVEKGRGMLPRR